MANELKDNPMMIHKMPSSVDYNHWLNRLNIQLNQPTNQSSIEVPKVVKSTNKNTLRTSVINSRMPPNTFLYYYGFVLLFN